MKKYILYCIATVLLTAIRASAQDPGFSVRARQYIDQYATLAIEEQKRSGVPASITLGQGILETEAGSSELMTQANNHFGIKCGKGWDGETFAHDDDAPQECFKKYNSAIESYKDHSNHLMRNPRYSPLFAIPQTDYSGWATCLKKCGYATNPQYAQRLVKIIEDYKLQEYTFSAMNNTAIPVSYHEAVVADNDPYEDTSKKTATTTDTTVTEKPVSISAIQHMADSARKVVTHPAEFTMPTQPAEPNSDSAFSNSKIVTVNGLKAFYAYKNDMLLQYAVKYNIRYPKLLEMNDLPDGPLPFDTYVYTEKKKGIGTHVSHTVKQGESLLMISQLEGIQLKRLMALNLIMPHEEPMAGAVLQLQTQATRKPQVTSSAIVAHKGNAIGGDNTGEQGGDYIATTKPKEAPTKPVKPVIKPKPSVPVEAAKTETSAEQPVAAVQEEDLSGLKAELDKVVYADDSKLIAQNAPAAPVKKITSTEPASTASGAKYYTVKKGDTAFSIAKRNNITIAQLMKWNSMYEGDVQAGQSLRVK